MVSEISPSSPPPWGPSIIHRNILNIIDRYGPLACPAATTQTAGEKMRKNATNRLIFQIQRSVHFLFKNYKKTLFFVIMNVLIEYSMYKPTPPT